MTGKITGFRRSFATDDAPSKESWAYTYVIIHISDTSCIVQAYRSYNPQKIYQRFCTSNAWSGGWFVFEGKSI